MRMLSLYIHIPFCVRKCYYCDFLSAPCSEDTRQEYVDALCREMEERAEAFHDKKVDTIFFGGGTPSILSVKQVEQIMSMVRSKFDILSDAEISLEMNPGMVDSEKLETYRKLGINRLSIGLQSANNKELEILGRIHTWEEFLNTWHQVRDAGFSNVNIDLMSALPGQTLKSYEETLRKVLALKPEHISAYSLIVEEGTLFYEWFGSDGEKDEQTGEENSRQKIEEDERSLEGGLAEVKSKKIPDEIIDRQMYELTKKLLEEQGYYRYEISNYALKGYECKHNIGYWKRKEYLGLGLGAASLVSNVRYRNISDLKSYLEVGKQPYENAESFQICQKQKEESSQVWQEKRKECIKNDSINRKWTEEQTKLSITDQREEFMFLGLRMMEGVSPKEFEEQFGQSIQEVYGTSLEKLERQGLLKFNEEIGKYALTLQGIDVSNQVFVEFLE